MDTIVQLAPNMFFGATISTCIIVLKKNKPDNRICFIDASAEFVHEGNKNKLSPENIRRIYDAHRRKEEVPHFCHVVTIGDVAEKRYNLSVSSYVEPEDTAVEVDIVELNQRIASIVEKEQRLRQEIDEIIKELSID